MEVLTEEINTICQIYYVEFCELEELLEARAVEELAESVDFLQHVLLYNVKRQSELENKDHSVISPNDVDDYCDLSERLINPSGHGQLFFMPFSSPLGGEHYNS